MKNKNSKLKAIYQRTDGYCHICHKKLCFKNYGKRGLKGSWQIEHSNAKANGGTDRANNLYAACVDCNCEKGTLSTRTVRTRYGYSRAPYNRVKKQEIQGNNTTAGIVIGGLLGLVGGPLGSAIGATIGGIIGNRNSPRT